MGLKFHKRYKKTKGTQSKSGSLRMAVSFDSDVFQKLNEEAENCEMSVASLASIIIESYINGDIIWNFEKAYSNA